MAAKKSTLLVEKCRKVEIWVISSIMIENKAFEKFFISIILEIWDPWDLMINGKLKYTSIAISRDDDLIFTEDLDFFEEVQGTILWIYLFVFYS